MEDLEGDLAVVFEVLSPVYRRHAAAAELVLEPVAAGQSLLEPFSEVSEVCHGASLDWRGTLRLSADSAQD